MKQTIGEHHLSLATAIKQLEDNYGCPQLIVEKYMKDYDKALGSIRSWGKHGTKERVDAINRTVDFIRNLQTLATDHPTYLQSEIYSKNTLLLLTKGMPHEYTKKLNESCGHADPFEDWLTLTFCKSVRVQTCQPFPPGLGLQNLVRKIMCQILKQINCHIMAMIAPKVISVETDGTTLDALTFTK